MKNYETLGNLSGYYHGTVGHISRCIAFDLCITKINRILWPFVAGWIISMMAHPVIEYLEKKVKLPKKFGSAILIAAVITGIIVVLYFAVRGIALQVIGFIQDAPDIRHEIMRQGMIFQKKIEQFLSILPPSFGKQFDQWSGSIGELFKKAASSAGDYGVAHAGGVAKGVTSGLLGLVVMLFAAYMFSLEREKLIAWYENVFQDL